MNTGPVLLDPTGRPVSATPAGPAELPMLPAEFIKADAVKAPDGSLRAVLVLRADQGQFAVALTFPDAIRVTQGIAGIAGSIIERIKMG